METRTIPPEAAAGVADRAIRSYRESLVEARKTPERAAGMAVAVAAATAQREFGVPDAEAARIARAAVAAYAAGRERGLSLVEARDAATQAAADRERRGEPRVER